MTDLRDKLSRAIMASEISGARWEDLDTYRQGCFENDADACMRVLVAEPVSREASQAALAEFWSREDAYEFTDRDHRNMAAALDSGWRAMLGVQP